ncbi:MAG: hypothetical protein ACFUZC_20155 [Chthoniobacteraceae bacterium]
MNLATEKMALGIAKSAIYVVSPILGHLMDVTVGSVNESKQVAEHGGIDELRKEAERQELMMQMAERQAKVTQELALARRIESALEVEMEEFYDGNASGHAGVDTDGSTLSLGIAGKGQKVTKRIFRFKGIIPNA